MPGQNTTSCLQGYYGESGRRRLHGGNWFQQTYKIVSVSICSNITGQVAASLIMNPPKPGDASYKSYVAERDNILKSLAHQAKDLENFYKSNTADGKSAFMQEVLILVDISFNLKHVLSSTIKFHGIPEMVPVQGLFFL